MNISIVHRLLSCIESLVVEHSFMYIHFSRGLERILNMMDINYFVIVVHLVRVRVRIR